MIDNATILSLSCILSFEVATMDIYSHVIPGTEYLSNGSWGGGGGDSLPWNFHFFYINLNLSKQMDLKETLELNLKK